MEQIKLNLGGGATPLPGYVNVDRQSGGEAYPLAYPDNHADELYASHILEHFGHRETLAVLQEWVRVLKPGGVLKVAVPNFAAIVDGYRAGADLPVQQYLMGGHVGENDRHGSVFDESLLRALLTHAGLIEVEPWESGNGDCAALPISLNLQGRKPVARKLRVACAMSVPRLGFQDNFFTWAEALTPLGIVPTAYAGAFWGQCLERVLAEQVASGQYDYILTVDYDTFFTRQTVAQLLASVATHPEIDALAPIQLKRGDHVPMLSLHDAQGRPQTEVDRSAMARALLKVDSAHFGCTLLKVDALRDLPHPWFKGVPADDGTWGQGHIDDDIWFWRQWAKAGNTLYSANRVVVGHGEYVVTWPDRQCGTLYQGTSEFRRRGLPAGVWE